MFHVKQWSKIDLTQKFENCRKNLLGVEFFNVSRETILEKCKIAALGS